jgi:hypothetical protein
LPYSRSTSATIYIYILLLTPLSLDPTGHLSDHQPQPKSHGHQFFKGNNIYAKDGVALRYGLHSSGTTGILESVYLFLVYMSILVARTLLHRLI